METKYIVSSCILGLLIIASVIIRMLNTPKVTKTDGGGQPDEEETPVSEKKGLRWYWLVIVAIVVGLLTWVLTSHHEQKKVTAAGPKTSSGITVVQPKEEWVLILGKEVNRDPLEVRIVKNDDEALWFDALYVCDGQMRISRHELSKRGNRFAGSWSQSYPKDGGTINLDKVGEQLWVGQSTDKYGQTYSSTLMRK